jgi:ABC-type antimicrobial peptide transport system permease subunit
LIDETTARLYFSGEDPIGQRLDYLRQFRRIVGIVEAIKQTSVTMPSEAALYFPVKQMSPVMAFNRLTGGIAVRTSGDPLELVPFVRTAVKEVDPTSPIYAVERLDDRLGATFAEPRFYSIVLGLFATLALVTSVLGIYGVLSYSVERRRVEFGVRRALGGGEGHILWLVLSQAARLVVAGIVLGSLIAGAGTGVLRNLLFGVRPVDMATFAFAAVFVLVVGLCAAGLPAWRAIRIDPARALRAD